jgi:hypothetical protein
LQLGDLVATIDVSDGERDFVLPPSRGERKHSVRIPHESEAIGHEQQVRTFQAAQPEHGADRAAEDEAGKAGLHGAGELIGLAAGSATLLTALAFYFGWTLTNARASYFGIDPSTLGFTTGDYVLRSADALYVPLGAIVLTVLAGVAIHSAFRNGLSDRLSQSAIRSVALACGAVGLVLLSLGIVAVFRPLPFPTHYLFAPLSPALGAVLIAYAIYLVRGPLSPVPVVLIGALLILSAFWATSRYADALGRGRAQDLAESLERRPRVVVYTSKRLQLDLPGVTETALDRPDSAYAFRYEGLRLLVHAGDKYFLLPETWSQEDGVAVVLSDTDDLRVEFRPGT